MFIVVRYEHDYNIPHADIFVTSIDSVENDLKIVREVTMDFLFDIGSQDNFDIHIVEAGNLAEHILARYNG